MIRTSPNFKANKRKWGEISYQYSFLFMLFRIISLSIKGLKFYNMLGKFSEFLSVFHQFSMESNFCSDPSINILFFFLWSVCSACFLNVFSKNMSKHPKKFIVFLNMEVYNSKPGNLSIAQIL